LHSTLSLTLGIPPLASVLVAESASTTPNTAVHKLCFFIWYNRKLVIL
jgi:hypothetical protein